MSSSPDLVVQELERPRPLIDHRYLNAERGEHRRVPDPDDSGADDDHGWRQMLPVEDGVRGRDGPVVRHSMPPGLLGVVPTAIEHVGRRQKTPSLGRLHQERVPASSNEARPNARARTSLRARTSCTVPLSLLNHAAHVPD